MTRNLARYTTLLLLVWSVYTFAQAPAAGTSAAPAAPAAQPAQPAVNPASIGPSKIGIIDMQAAIAANNEGRRDLEALQKKFEPRQTQLQNLNKEIEDLRNQLKTQGDKLNEETRANLVKQIETKNKTLQRDGEDAQNDYQQQQNEIAQRILGKLGPVIDKYAKENGFSLILDASNPWPQSPLLWAGQQINITQTIITTYNAQSGVPAPPAATKPSTAANRPATAPAKPATPAPKQ